MSKKYIYVILSVIALSLLISCSNGMYSGEVTKVVKSDSSKDSIAYVLVEALDKPISGSDEVRLNIDEEKVEEAVLSKIEEGKTIEFQIGDSIAEPIPPQTIPKSIKILDAQ